MFSRANPRRRQGTLVFPAPSRGWIKNEALLGASTYSAEVLDNFFPTAQGARARKGSTLKATLDAAATQILTHQSAGTGTLIAATANDVYDVTTPADAEVAETPVMSIFTAGDWAYTQFSTAAGDYLVAVNGSDYEWTYDGTDFQPVADENPFDMAYDALTAEFTLGSTVTGGTSGATAKILGDHKTSATAGTLKIGTITGTFQDNETITDAVTGSATSDIPSGTSSATSINISGVQTNTLSHVWAHQRRLWYIEKNTFSAWYLATTSIGGTATEFPMGALFAEGGSLLFGATWSIESGEGTDDLCLFVTTEGEIAVYKGTDPSSASTWALEGLYKIGRPLGKTAWFRSGGDVQILTEDGIISVSEALRKDRTAVQASALTYPIEEAWQSVVASRSASFNFSATLWQSRTMLLVGIPDSGGDVSVSYAANARTGAWGRFTGWDVQCSAELDDVLYFGTSDNKVLIAESSGADQGQPYVGKWVPKFSEGGSAGVKFATYGQLLARAAETFTPRIQAFSDYQVGEFKSAPAAATSSASVWGTGIWGTSTWGSTEAAVSVSKWKGVRAQGYSIAPAVQISFGDTPAPNVELICAKLQYETGSPV